MHDHVPGADAVQGLAAGMHVRRGRREDADLERLAKHLIGCGHSAYAKARRWRGLAEGPARALSCRRRSGESILVESISCVRGCTMRGCESCFGPPAEFEAIEGTDRVSVCNTVLVCNKIVRVDTLYLFAADRKRRIRIFPAKSPLLLKERKCLFGGIST